MSRRVARHGIESSRFENHCAKLARDPVLDHHLLHARWFGHLARHQIEQQHAESVNVAAHIGLPETELLGRGESARAELHGVRRSPVVESTGDPQVDKDHFAPGKHKVARLDIPMDERRVE